MGGAGGCRRGRVPGSAAEQLLGIQHVKTKHFVALAGLALVGLAGCDSNDRNRDYNTRSDRGASMDTATSTGSGGNRGYYVPENRMGDYRGNTYDNRGMGTNNRGTGTSNTGTGNTNTTRPRNTMEPGMGMVNEKAKDGCCASSCDKSGTQN